MGSLSLRVCYRPVRIGWCVQSDRLEHLQSALRLTHAFAGGRFNPVIPVDRTELAEHLVDRFRVDLLFAVEDTDAITAFVQAHDYLHWPERRQALFHETWHHIPPRGAFVDVYHSARLLRETSARRHRLLFRAWEHDDALGLPLLALAGSYPPPSPQVPDYEAVVGEILKTERRVLGRTDPVPAEIGTQLTPSRLTEVGLVADHEGPDSGVYVGDAGNFEDIVNFWNLRAAGAELIFYDLEHADRLTPLLAAHRRWLDSTPPRPWQRDGLISVYRREAQRAAPVPPELGRALRHDVSAVSWNGLNVRPALWHWEEHPVLGSVDESGNRASLTFALPKKPAVDHPHLSRQYIAASIRGCDPWTFAGTTTFFPPYVPELNEYYGRELHHHYACVRAEPRSAWDSVSVLVNLSSAGRNPTSIVDSRALDWAFPALWHCRHAQPCGANHKSFDCPDGRIAGLPRLQD